MAKVINHGGMNLQLSVPGEPPAIVHGRGVSEIPDGLLEKWLAANPDSAIAKKKLIEPAKEQDEKADEAMQESHPALRSARRALSAASPRPEPAAAAAAPAAGKPQAKAPEKPAAAQPTPTQAPAAQPGGTAPPRRH